MTRSILRTSRASRPRPLIQAVSTRRTTIDIGTSFELHALRFLTERLFMTLRRVGGAGDGGVDLRGWWWVPRGAPSGIKASSPNPDPNPNPNLISRSTTSEAQIRKGNNDGDMDVDGAKRIRVMVQCKAEKNSVGPRAVREMEGVMSQLQSRNQSPPAFPPASSSPSPSVPSITDDSIALLISQSGFSKNAMLHATKSNTPLMLVHLPGGQPFDDLTLTSTAKSESRPRTSDEDEDDEIEAESIWWNKALSEGVLRNKVDIRREVLPSGGVRVGLWTEGGRMRSMEPVSQG
ncbi:hypothetical protein IAR55_004949 [Kwoniella newhampshirensis]|uniref:Restriction endonuclease type IV Mrr domain-containing protein n=1 Tax=Kwoniella newhampshirensis TaxID=1651941 RepID=A0AAW0YIX1_9TREE